MALLRRAKPIWRAGPWDGTRAPAFVPSFRAGAPGGARGGGIDGAICKSSIASGGLNNLDSNVALW